jgi:hypothetical protein
MGISANASAAPKLRLPHGLAIRKTSRPAAAATISSDPRPATQRRELATGWVLTSPPSGCMTLTITGTITGQLDPASERSAPRCAKIDEED